MLLENQYYRRKPRRMTDFDYNQAGRYFITITPRIRRPYFGAIRNGIVCLSTLGQIVYNQWLWLQKYPQIELDQFIVMPDHFHGIICIRDVDDVVDDRLPRDVVRPTRGLARLEAGCQLLNEFYRVSFFASAVSSDNPSPR